MENAVPGGMAWARWRGLGIRLLQPPGRGSFP